METKEHPKVSVSENIVAPNLITMETKEQIEQKIKDVNRLLLEGEPDDISVDTYSGFTGYKPQYVIDSMNSTFGIGGWGFREVSMEHEEENGLMIANVEVFITGIDFKPTAYGQSRITKGDFGDAKKGAQTDAIKKALSYFSIGNRAFHGKLPGGSKKASGTRQAAPGQEKAPKTYNPKSLATDKQINYIRSLIVEKGLPMPDDEFFGTLTFINAQKSIEKLLTKYPHRDKGDNKTDIEGTKQDDYNPQTGELL